MDKIELSYGGHHFILADHDKYPGWHAPILIGCVRVMGDTHRTAIETRVGVRYGKNWLRTRVLRAARAANPDRTIDDNCSITTRAIIGLEWTGRYDDEHERWEISGNPELYFGVKGKEEFYVDRRAQCGPLQRTLDGCTFGITNESLLDDVWDALNTSEGMRLSGDEEAWYELVERALRALHEPPTKAPAFPTKWQDYVIERWRRDSYEPEEFSHITEEAMGAFAALGLEPDEKSVVWDTYPPRFAVRCDPSTLLDVINAATDAKADQFAVQCPAFAELVATYRRKLLTPKTVLATAVPLYAEAMDAVDPQLRVSRGGCMEYSWEISRDFDPDEAGGDADKACEAVIDGVMADVEDAVDYLCGVFAKQYEDHYDYITSDEGVWEEAEAGGDFSYEFVRHVTND